MNDYVISLLTIIIPSAINALIVLVNVIFTHWHDKKIVILTTDLNTKLEKSKAELAKGAYAIEAAFSRHQRGQDIVAEQQIKAAQHAWSRVLAIKEVCQPYIDADIFAKQGQRSLNDMMKLGCPDAGKAYQQFLDIRNNDSLICDRLYLGEDFWGLYLTYRAFMCRILHYYCQCAESDREVLWSEDELLLDFLKKALLEETVGKLSNVKTSFLTKAESALETRICNEIHSILTGEKASRESLKIITDFSQYEAENKQLDLGIPKTEH